MYDSTSLVALAVSAFALAGITFALTVVGVVALVRDHRRSLTPPTVTITRQPRADLQHAA